MHSSQAINPHTKVLLSVIIVNYNVQYFLALCLDAVQRAAQGLDVEIIVVDNHSSDNSCAMLREQYKEVQLIANDTNRGFSQANNQAVAVAKGKYLLFLNPDTVMPEDFLQKALQYLEQHPNAGALGPRLIDGKGAYAPDGKKAFPSLMVALFKTTGIYKLFPSSPFFNRYYAVHIGERQTAAVEVLSGCCMFVRSALLAQIGPAFDESYFMYCEDVDLSYRIQKAGFENIYYPEINLIHYKGESTRKSTLSYIKIFNEALVTFVKKHYTKRHAQLFILFIKFGIGLRAVWAFIKMLFKLLKTPIFDALLLWVLLLVCNEFWVEGVKHLKPISTEILSATFPVYIAIWLVSMYLNGAYDQPYRPLRVIRGMLIGTVIILAYYGVLSEAYRYSRAVIFFAGVGASLGIVLMRALLDYLGIARVTRYNKVAKRAVIVGQPSSFEHTAALLQKVHYGPEIVGRVSVAPQGIHEPKGNHFSLSQMKETLYALNVQEVIFCAQDISYQELLRQMEHCGAAYDYKIHLEGSKGFVGSNQSSTSGDFYATDPRYNISSFVSKRNKRVFDIVASMCLLVLFPILMFKVAHVGQFLQNIFLVMLGKKTWVAYAPCLTELPKIKQGVLPTYSLQQGFEPDETIIHLSAKEYAMHYVVGIDFAILLRNLKFLGKK